MSTFFQLRSMTLCGPCWTSILRSLSEDGGPEWLQREHVNCGVTESVSMSLFLVGQRVLASYPLFMGSRPLETPAMALRRMRARFQKLIKNSNSVISRRPRADERRKFSLPLWFSSQCEAAF
jgi:hypothetical protein